MKPSERNKLDRKLLADAIERADEKAAEAFAEMLIALEAPPKRTVLTDKQRTWAENICGVETYENLVSSGKVPRGKEVPTPAVLLIKPLKPPGRK